jgi:hypothetical protein
MPRQKFWYAMRSGTGIPVHTHEFIVNAIVLQSLNRIQVVALLLTRQVSPSPTLAGSTLLRLDCYRDCSEKEDDHVGEEGTVARHRHLHICSSLVR